MISALLIAMVLNGGAESAPGVDLKDEGTEKGRVTKLNCVGSGITCSRSGTTGTINVPSAAASVLVQSLETALAADTTTTSAAFVDLLTQSITISSGGILIVHFTGGASSSNAAGVLSWRLTVDGTPKRGIGGTSTGAGAPFSIALQERITGLSAAAHTVKIQWKTTGPGTARIRPVAAPDDEHGSLICEEVTN